MTYDLGLIPVGALAETVKIQNFVRSSGPVVISDVDVREYYIDCDGKILNTFKE